MIKLTIYIIATIGLISCVRPEKKNKIKEFIFIGYGWTIQNDSLIFQIHQYFELDSNVQIKAASNIGKENYKYFLEECPDTLLNKINKTLIGKEYQKEYSNLDKGVDIYDGFTYFIYYKTKTDKETAINYIPRYIPTNLDSLHEEIIDFFHLNKFSPTKKFDFNNIVNTIEKQIPDRLRPPPLMPMVKIGKKVVFTGTVKSN